VSDRAAEPDGTDRTARTWAERRNLAERLFPGPTNPMSKQAADHVQRLIRTRGGQPDALPVPRRPSSDRHAASDTAPEDLASLREALDAQNELLRALLSSSTDAQADARSTAQNSRTFAWAGTVIALLTLVATIVLIVNGG
jgi:hypothetical protein